MLVLATNDAYISIKVKYVIVILRRCQKNGEKEEDCVKLFTFQGIM